MQQRTLTLTDGQKISYSVSGSETGAPVVLLHGFPFSSNMWRSQIEALKDFRVIAPDLRGAGKSPATQGPFSMETLVDDLIALLDQEKIAKATVVGFSMGGYLALRAIERNPERFQALVLTDTKSAPDNDEAKLKRAGAMKSVKADGVAAYADAFLKGAVSPTTLEKKADTMKTLKTMITEASSKTGVVETLLAIISRTDTTKALSQIKVPTLVLVGSDDKVTPLADAQAMQAAINGSELKVIPEAGHMSPVENPSAVNETLLGFLAK